MSWAKQSAKEDKIVEVGKSLCHLRAFQILPRRWVVECSFGWISHKAEQCAWGLRQIECNQRGVLVYAAMNRLMLRRLAST
jgi:transposase